jgi:hypothetical protein
VFLDKHPEYNEFDNSKEVRTHPDLIKYVEKSYNEKGHCRVGGDFIFADLCVADLPRATTDFYIKEYDGAETVLFVVNGKIEEY